MEGFGGGSASDLAPATSVRRKRSNTSRRPRPDSSHTLIRDSFHLSKSRLADDGYEDDVKDSKKKSRSENITEDTDYTIEEGKREISLTTRQRALQGGKDTMIEFPDGLPPPAPRKQKDKLTEAEQQQKKAEAAQRRRMQVEKAARESNAEAIRKIRGQNSTRKKKQQQQQRRDEGASAVTLPPNTIRWVIDPTGTLVTFPPEMGLPSILGSNSSSYPPPREKCALPSCSNAYKYRAGIQSRSFLCAVSGVTRQ